jgi:hypothetical protein
MTSVMERQEVRDCVEVLELEDDEIEIPESVVQPVMVMVQPLVVAKMVNPKTAKKKKEKLLGKRAQKKQNFADVVARTRKMTDWILKVKKIQVESEKDLRIKEANRKRETLLTGIIMKELIDGLVVEVPGRSMVAGIMDKVLDLVECLTNRIWSLMVETP